MDRCGYRSGTLPAQLPAKIKGCACSPSDVRLPGGAAAGALPNDGRAIVVGATRKMLGPSVGLDATQHGNKNLARSD